MSAVLRTVTAAAAPALRSFEAQWQARVADALEPVREQAMQRFMKLGLPTSRDESWRYTDLRSLAARTFVDTALLDTPVAGASVNEAHPLLAPEDRAATLVVLDGKPLFDPKILAISGITINSIRDLSIIDSRSMARFFEPLSDAEQSRFALLNTALFRDGLHIRLSGRLHAPLVIMHVSRARAADSIGYPRVIIEAAAGSSATVIEHHVSGSGNEEVASDMGDAEYAPAGAVRLTLSNSATHIALAADAQIEHYRVFATSAGTTHVDSLDILQGRSSHCKQFTVALGGGLVRTNLEARLDQPGAALDSFALLVGHAQRHVDCLNIVTHAAPDTRSRQTARALASDVSRVIFNSKVIVEAGAARSDSQQSCRGLLLSPTAEIDSRPQLEIHADEVKCAHGATTGRLDPDMLFYLLSRGLDRHAAQSLLVFAFLADAISAMSVGSARTAIENALISQLPDAQLLRKFR